jgi:ketosteroid isomerase-like protein
MSASIEQVSTAYLNAWSSKDLEGIAALLHPDIHFRSPNADTHGREAYLAAVARMFPLLLRIDVRAQLHGSDSAMFVYDFVCREPVGAARTAELVRFADGLIRDSEVFFDPRPFEALAAKRSA